MAITIIYQDHEPVEVEGEAREDELWLSSEALEGATGWEIKPEGICRDEMCISLPADRSGMLREGAKEDFLNLAAFAGYLEQPFARTDGGDVWCFGSSPEEKRTQLLSLEAPDFRLPGRDGRTYSLSEFRGKKVFLLLWASW